jgi:hypothetical protein
MSDLLRQNSELRKDRIWNYSIPAWHVTLPNGKRFMTCPNAGACAQVCYARANTFMFAPVLKSHTDNLMRYLTDRREWIEAIVKELKRPKFRPNGVDRNLPIQNDEWLERWSKSGGAAVRIHDAGDFFSEQYLRDWLQIADRTQDVLFYAYTKEIKMFRSTPQVDETINFRFLFSTGGLQDDLINVDTDRHADVFASREAMQRANYFSQDDNDLLAIALPTTKVGITANNIPHFNKKINGRRFSELRHNKR